LQDFIHQHGSLEKALEAVARVNQLIGLTGGVSQLNAALQIVGGESASQA
jgi:hypothetical protein